MAEMEDEALRRDVTVLGRAYGWGFISHEQAHEILTKLLGLPPVVRERPSLPIYCPPEYFWRECECGRKGQQEGQC